MEPIYTTESKNSMVLRSLVEAKDLVKSTVMKDSNYDCGTGTTTAGSAVKNCYDYYRDYRYPTYYPAYHYPEDKGLRAMRILQKLMDNKLIKVEKVKDFVDLMNELINIL